MVKIKRDPFLIGLLEYINEIIRKESFLHLILFIMATTSHIQNFKNRILFYIILSLSSFLQTHIRLWHGFCYDIYSSNKKEDL